MTDPSSLRVSAPRIPRPVTGHLDVPGIVDAIAENMMYTVAKDEFTASKLDVYHALAYAVRDRLMERWFLTQDTYYRLDAKRVYYLSMEFLPGRALLNNILNLSAHPAYARALDKLGYELFDVAEQEPDAGLGNGGLGRLAACFADSAATLALPFFSYGIRYEYGIFRQRIQDGQQVEAPDTWLRYGNPWEIPRPDSLVRVRFYGRSVTFRDEAGEVRTDWVDSEDIYAMAYDTPVIGFDVDTVNSLRLWSARSTREFDLATFNAGDYVRAVEDKTRTENITRVLYPPDDQDAGRELRLKQQHFFVSATLQDVIRRFKKRPGRSWQELPDKVAIQLNDTHPAVAIPGLMRLLVDEERVTWDEAWEITRAVFGFTNHTILPEALETWPTEVFGRLLPRHLQIVEEIDRRLRAEVRRRFPGDEEKVSRTAILTGNGDASRVNMARLAIAGSHAVNGVARLHSEILKTRTFRDFHDLDPDSFSNKTNGVTPRRWLLKCNPALASLVTEAISDRWLKDLNELSRLGEFVEDSSFRERWAAIKRENKSRLADYCRRAWNLTFDPEALLDVQVKRIHEYKRQLLNLLHVVALAERLKESGTGPPPRTVLFAGKAAPGYAMAKLIIRLIHAVAETVNGDPRLAGRLRVVFLPNYDVSLAERIFPACELSEQISTAGHEASGTGNMKAALGGALTIGTLDGANIEIRDQVGNENIFIFGHTSDEIAELKSRVDDPKRYVAESPDLARVIETISALGGTARTFDPIVNELLGQDAFFNCADFGSYMKAQATAAAVWNTDDWWRKSIRNVAGMGPFSSDRAVREYAQEIWKVEAVSVRFE